MYLSCMFRMIHPMFRQQDKKVLGYEPQALAHIVNLAMGEVVHPGENPVLAFEDEPTPGHQDPVDLPHGQEVEIPQVLDGAHQFSEPGLQGGTGARPGHERWVEHYRTDRTVLQGQPAYIRLDHSDHPWRDVETKLWPGLSIGTSIKISKPKGWVTLNRPGVQVHDVLQNLSLGERDGFDYFHDSLKK